MNFSPYFLGKESTQTTQWYIALKASKLLFRLRLE